jgi:HEPN domain-containing protein
MRKTGSSSPWRTWGRCGRWETRHLRQASFLLQQAAEKALKGFLLSHGQELRFTHDLEVLLSDATGFDPGLAKYEEACAHVSLCYIQERYPGERRLSPTEGEFMRIAPTIEAMVEALRTAASQKG